MKECRMPSGIQPLEGSRSRRADLQLLLSTAILLSGMMGAPPSVRAAEERKEAEAAEKPARQGDEPAEPAAGEEDEAQKAERAARLEMMRKLVRGLETILRKDGELVKLEPMPEPLFRYADNARNYVDGSIWAWGSEGRPLALVTVAGRGKPGAGQWDYEFNLLSLVQLTMSFEDGLTWRPTATEVQLQDLPKTPAPAETEARRLLQMKDIVRRFTCFEYWQEVLGPGTKQERYEMRVLPRPIARYRQEKEGLIDGALFIGAYGTNPEVIVVLEAWRKGDDPPVWRCGFTRISYAEVHMIFDGTEIWKTNQIRGTGARDGYVLTGRPWRAETPPVRK